MALVCKIVYYWMPSKDGALWFPPSLAADERIIWKRKSIEKPLFIVDNVIFLKTKRIIWAIFFKNIFERSCRVFHAR